MRVADKIRYFRHKNGMTAAELGESIDVTQGTVSRYENGYVQKIPYDKLELLAKAFNCSVADLIEGDPAYHLIDVHEGENDDATVLSTEDIALLNWYHGLPESQQKAFQRVFTSHNKETNIFVFGV